MTLALALAGSMMGAGAAGLRAGAARVAITPADLTGLNPFGGGDFTGVHDPIFARALWLESGGEQAAIVSLDLPEVGDMRGFLARIQRETGVRADHVMLIATHDHSAPRLGDVSPGTAAQKAGAPSLRWSQIAYDRIIAAIRQARGAARPATFGAARGYVDVNINRDVPDGKGGMMLGKDPHGVSDKTVWTARFDGLDGRPIAILFTYAVHSTVSFGLKEVSGDLGGAAERFVESHAGDGVVALYAMAAAGDQAPRADRPAPLDGSKLSPAQDRALAWAAMDAQGLMLGNEVMRVAAKVTAPTGQVRIMGVNRDVACPTKPGSGAMATMTSVSAPQVTLRLSLLMLNDVAITGVGGEVVTNIYHHFMKETPLPQVLFATNVNDRIGYIADDAAYDRPTFEVKGSPLARGCAENAIVANLTQMIREQGK
jgi:neutral ceramidase